MLDSVGMALIFQTPSGLLGRSTSSEAELSKIPISAGSLKATSIRGEDLPQNVSRVGTWYDFVYLAC